MLLISLINISDDSYDLSSTSDISQVKTTEEVLKVYHQVDMTYHTNGSPVLSSGITPCPSRPSRKPPYSEQCGPTFHDIFPYEFLLAHVLEVETVVVPDNDITEKLNHGFDDLYDASYEMDPFDIDTPVGAIQAYACMNENVSMPMDKWFGLNHKTKDLRDQIDDTYNSVRLGCTKLPSSSSFPSRPPSKPPFPLNRVAISTFMRCLPMSFHRYILMNWNQTLYQMKPSPKTHLFLIKNLKRMSNGKKFLSWNHSL
jgi:hypothetical protein